MKIRMDSEDGDGTWFTALRFDGPVQDPTDWAYLINCMLKGTSVSTVDILDELLDGLELYELRFLKKRLDEMLAEREANLARALASDATCESKEDKP